MIFTCKASGTQSAVWSSLGAYTLAIYMPAEVDREFNAVTHAGLDFRSAAEVGRSKPATATVYISVKDGVSACAVRLQ